MEEMNARHIEEYVEEQTEERGRTMEVVRRALNLSEEEVSDWMDRSFERWWKDSVHGCKSLTSTF